MCSQRETDQVCSQRETDQVCSQRETDGYFDSFLLFVTTCITCTAVNQVGGYLLHATPCFFPMRCLLLSAIYCYDVMCIGRLVDISTGTRFCDEEYYTFRFFLSALCADNIYIALYKVRAAVLVKSTHSMRTHLIVRCAVTTMPSLVVSVTVKGTLPWQR